jgi:hypothetical protein
MPAFDLGLRGNQASGNVDGFAGLILVKNQPAELIATSAKNLRLDWVLSA